MHNLSELSKEDKDKVNVDLASSFANRSASSLVIS
ncbi:DNA polymerase III subunit theta [Providencia rettgeri]|nr:DNA polymerase III subunit theta [Providencia rettgeri]